mgnify:CR=1
MANRRQEDNLLNDGLGRLGESPKSPLTARMPEFDCAQIEYTLKIPRALDHRMAEELNERHKRFVEEEFRRFSLALSDAERLSSEYRSASRRSHEDGQENI